MSHLKTINSSLKIIEETSQKLESGELTLEELNQFVIATQELFEKALILRYKAYEIKIGMEHVGDHELKAANTTFDEKTAIEPLTSNETEAIEIHTEQDEEIDQDFNLYSNEGSDSPFSFDLFNDNTEAFRTETIEGEAVEHLTISSSSHEENGVVEEHVLMEQVKRVPVETENKMFMEHFSVIEADLFHQIGMTRLETLHNCFGLNEKFVYINELFNGSKDDFNEAIQQIENDASYHDALLTASTYANKYNWDIESTTVMDFITKLKRRHG